MADYFTVEPCATSGAFEIKLKEARIDLKKAAALLSPMGDILADTPVVLVMKVKIHSVSVYASGRLMFKNATKKEAERLGQEMLPVLENGGALVKG